MKRTSRPFHPVFGFVVGLTLLSVSCKAFHGGGFTDHRFISLSSDEAPVDYSQVISLTFALKVPHANHLHERLLAVSTPGSPLYRHYLTNEDIVSLSGVKEEHVQMVVNWLAQSGVDKGQIRVGRTKDMIRAKATIHTWERALGTHFRWFHPKDDESGLQVHRRRLRVTEHMGGVPSHVADCLAFISANTPVHFHSPLSGKALRITEESLVPNAKASFKVNEGQDTAEMVFDVKEKNTRNLNKLVVELTDTAKEYPQQTLTLSSDQFSCEPKKRKNKNSKGDDLSTCRVILSHLPKYTTFKADLSGVYSTGSDPIPLAKSPPFTLTDVATPDFLNKLYDIPDGITVQHGSTQAVAEFYGEFWSPKDLDDFCDLAGIPRQHIDKENVRGDNPNDPKKPGGEAQLDVEYIQGIARNATTWFYSIKERNPFSHANEGFLTWLEYLSEDQNPPLVHSLSYGDEEPEIFNASVPGAIDYARRIDLEFLKYGLRGLTIVTASGDDGSAAPYCYLAWPSWPSTSPYITVVGATQLSSKYLPLFESHEYSGMRIPAVSTKVRETSCSSSIGGVITSGGGFSNIYGRDEQASWQSKLVEEYLSTPGATPSRKWFNTTGRAYPDISAYGSNYFIHLDGKVSRESGTSASTPVFSAMVTLWNDVLLAKGQKPLGFINPTLYHLAEHYPEAFNDVVTGNNACAAGHGNVMCCDEAFHAAPGWDATTGIGTPRWKVIAELLLTEPYSSKTLLLGSSRTAVSPQAPTFLWGIVLMVSTVLVVATYYYHHHHPRFLPRLSLALGREERGLQGNLQVRRASSGTYYQSVSTSTVGNEGSNLPEVA